LRFACDAPCVLLFGPGRAWFGWDLVQPARGRRSSGKQCV
jgi:hypothetical protein